MITDKILQRPAAVVKKRWFEIGAIPDQSRGQDDVWRRLLAASAHARRLTVNSGSIDALGGLKAVAIGEYKNSQTALSRPNAWFVNRLVKAEKPPGNSARLSIL